MLAPKLLLCNGSGNTAVLAHSVVPCCVLVICLKDFCLNAAPCLCCDWDVLSHTCLVCAVITPRASDMNRYCRARVSSTLQPAIVIHCYVFNISCVGRPLKAALLYEASC